MQEQEEDHSNLRGIALSERLFADGFQPLHGQDSWPLWQVLQQLRQSSEMQLPASFEVLLSQDADDDGRITVEQLSNVFAILRVNIPSGRISLEQQLLLALDEALASRADGLISVVDLMMALPLQNPPQGEPPSRTITLRSVQSSSNTLQFSGQEVPSPTYTVAHQDGREGRSQKDMDIPVPPSIARHQDAPPPPYEPAQDMPPRLFTAVHQAAPSPPPPRAAGAAACPGGALLTEPMPAQPVQIQQHGEAAGDDLGRQPAPPPAAPQQAPQASQVPHSELSGMDTRETVSQQRWPAEQLHTELAAEARHVESRPPLASPQDAALLSSAGPSQQDSISEEDDEDEYDEDLDEYDEDEEEEDSEEGSDVSNSGDESGS